MRSQRRHRVRTSALIVALATVLALDVVGLALGRVLRERRRRQGGEGGGAERS